MCDQAIRRAFLLVATRLLEAVDGLVRVAGHHGDAGKDEIGASSVGHRLDAAALVCQRLTRQRGGAVRVAGLELELGQVKALQFVRRGPNQHILIGLGVKLDDVWPG